MLPPNTGLALLATINSDSFTVFHVGLRVYSKGFRLLKFVTIMMVLGSYNL